MTKISQRIQNLDLRYLVEFQPLFDDLTQYGGAGSKDEIYIQSKAFSNAYEFYIYSFFVGLHKNKKEEILMSDNSKTFWEMSGWKHKELANYMLMCAITDSNFDMVAIENMEDNEVNCQIELLKQTIEGYANGGIRYIREKLDEDPALRSDDMFFMRLLSED